jgi:hypothetical protein
VPRRAPLALLACLLAVFLAPSGAAGQGLVTTGSLVDESVRSLQNDPVFVDPQAEEAISEAEAEQLRRKIVAEGAGPMYIAVTRSAIVNEAGGDPSAAAFEIAERVGQPGVYALIAGSSFRAGASRGLLDRGVPRALVNRALEEEGGTGDAYRILDRFVVLVGEAKRNGGSARGGDGNDPGGGGAGALGLLALIGGGFGLMALRRRKRERREMEAQVADLRETAEGDLVALADDVRALDIDVQMPSAPPEAKADYEAALGRYEAANRALQQARTPEDFGPIGQALEEGRFAMAAAKARLAGHAPPERRPPCFFDPRHGPSTREVAWSPDGYEQRPVPVCEADAVRLESGQAPMTREIETAGGRVPIYDAPAYYGPYAGGFFGGFSGFLPGLLFGSLLSGGLGGGGFGFGGPFGVGGFGGGLGGDGGGFGGGDFGGGGGFDFGDFGGGDFGGGGFGGGDF